MAGGGFSASLSHVLCITDLEWCWQSFFLLFKKKKYPWARRISQILIYLFVRLWRKEQLSMNIPITSVNLILSPPLYRTSKKTDKTGKAESSIRFKLLSQLINDATREKIIFSKVFLTLLVWERSLISYQVGRGGKIWTGHGLCSFWTLGNVWTGTLTLSLSCVQTHKQPGKVIGWSK